MRAIAVVDTKWGLGKQGQLLFRIPEDMRYFQQKTSGEILIMGSTTLRSFPGGHPLPGRVNIVLTRHPEELAHSDYIVCKNASEAMKTAAEYVTKTPYLIGGANVFAQLIDCCDQAFITKVDADGEAECFMPALDGREGWELMHVSEPELSNGYTIRFCEYQNANVKPVPNGDTVI